MLLDVVLLVVNIDVVDVAAVDVILVVVTPCCITEPAAKVDTLGCVGLCTVLLLVKTTCCWTLFEVTATGMISAAVDLFVDSCLEHALRSSAIILRVYAMVCSRRVF